MIKTVKLFSKNVKNILDDLKNGGLNYMDFEEDYDFLTCEEKKELFAVLNFVGKECKNINFVEV